MVPLVVDMRSDVRATWKALHYVVPLVFLSQMLQGLLEHLAVLYRSWGEGQCVNYAHVASWFLSLCLK